jgi:hypothetical protein
MTANVTSWDLGIPGMDASMAARRPDRISRRLHDAFLCPWRLHGRGIRGNVPQSKPPPMLLPLSPRGFPDSSDAHGTEHPCSFPSSETVCRNLDQLLSLGVCEGSQQQFTAATKPVHRVIQGGRAGTAWTRSRSHIRHPPMSARGLPLWKGLTGH